LEEEEAMIISLDIGFSNTGWSIFNKGGLLDIGVIQTKKTEKRMVRVSDDNVRRCIEIANEIDKLKQKYGLQGVLGELPSGSQNARAANQFGLIIGTVGVAAHFLGLPAEWCSQQEVKKATTGNRFGGKDDVMTAICDMVGVTKTTKIVKITKGKRKGKETIKTTYHLMGKKFPESKFEHIADSIGVYMALKTGNLVKMFG